MSLTIESVYTKEDFFNDVIADEEFYWDLYGHNLWGNAIVGIYIMDAWKRGLTIKETCEGVDELLCQQ